MTDLIEYADREMMFIALANRIAGELNSHVMRTGAATLAVPGGTTPGPCFDDLSAARLDWDKVRIVPTDERWVPETSDRSNGRLIRQRLLTDRASAAEFVPLYADAPVPQDRLEALSDAVSGLLPLTVLLLGMGEDMHVASLFPGADGLTAALDSAAPPLAAFDGPDLPEPRVSLTAPVLRGALHAHILITGPEKRAALERARGMDDPEQAPVLTVLRDATIHWAE